MLRQRIITALVLVVVLASAVFFWPPFYLTVLLAVVCLFAAQECARLQKLPPVTSWLCAAAVTGLAFLAMQSIGSDSALWLARGALLLWIGLVAWLVWAERNGLPAAPTRWSGVAVCVLLVIVCVLVNLLHASGAWLLLYVLAIAWAADIGAYFSGKRFGRRKLAPRLSPGKSIEGLFGGLFAVLVLAIAVLPLFDIAAANPTAWVVASLVAALFSVSGDLFESTLKRTAGVKDSGWILPGHGGVLDRIDSLLASVPVFIALCPAVLP